MGRPRKYNTKEEQCDAHRQYSKKYYNKNKWSINKSQRRSCRLNDHKAETPKAKATKIKASQDNIAKSAVRCPSKLDLAKKQIEDIPRKLRAHLNNKPKETLLADICARYQELYKAGEPHKGKLMIEREMAKFGLLFKELKDSRKEVLNLCGVGREYRQSKEVEQQIEEVVHALEELWEIVLLDPDQLVTNFWNGALDFQRVI
ncbi:hypothetical protein EST38_g12365 [Candolleomyces aberdarensis]|uniref:Uncharacterized protein n=1 Tax=Candolleomyces aberdarensis TaxID=2316362 RepID=A0A4Q2D5P0_9AGAR|nr:hypothetical protein EST38_g12365 [Candolleomyces aberdarensis]